MDLRGKNLAAFIFVPFFMFAGIQTCVAYGFTGAPGQANRAGKESPVKIIFDTDMDSDCDDAGALAVLHALADRGECEILGVMISSGHPYSPYLAGLVTVLYAVRGELDYWDIPTEGYMDLRPSMMFKWEQDKKDKAHAYHLKKRVNGEYNAPYIELVIDSLLIPKTGLSGRFSLYGRLQATD